MRALLFGRSEKTKIT